MTSRLFQAAQDLHTYYENAMHDPHGSKPWVRLGEILAEGDPTEAPSGSAWLIEQVGRTAWVGNPRGCHPRNGWVWTTAEQAIRFAREDDAYAAAFALKIEPSQFKVTEHLWMAATQPAEAEAPSDAEIEALDFAIGRLCDDCNPDGSVDSEAARAISTLALMRRNRQPADRAVEALRGLVEAVDKLRASENTERRKGYLRAFADDDLLGDLFDAASAAKEVLK